MSNHINIIGGGLAGCEAAYQIAKQKIPVKLYEMKPIKFSPAHSNKDLAEIVCSNSFKSNSITNACGLLKEELRRLDSLLIRIADETKVPAGQALAVDRDIFARRVTQEIQNNPYIEIINTEIGCDSDCGTGLNESNAKHFEPVGPVPKGAIVRNCNILLTDLTNDITIIATGPLTSDALSKEIKELTGGENLAFYDAAAPIIEKDSIDFNIAFYGDRYGKEGDSSYINLPFTKEEYELFYNELINAEVVTLHEFEKREIFEGCMPIEVMAKRGEETIRFGPLKPVGFTDPRTGNRPYAIVQLRQDNSEGTLYNIVGFQTNLKFSEQKRVFSLIPGLKNAEFARYGVMHRNTYINSPKLLDATYNMKNNNNIYFAGQITGVEGYVESISSGMVAALNAINQYNGQKKQIFSKETIIGALADYISSPNENFSPMNANFGILPGLSEKIRDKQERYAKLAEKSLNNL